MSTSTAPHSLMDNSEMQHSVIATQVLKNTIDKYDTSAFYLWGNCGGRARSAQWTTVGKSIACHRVTPHPCPLSCNIECRPRCLLGSMRAGRHAMSSKFSSRPPYQLHCGTHVVVPRTHWRTCRPPCLLGDHSNSLHKPAPCKRTRLP